MTDDIVTRLRGMATESLFGVSMAPFEYHIAADEIERLRADAKRWRNWAIDYACDDTTCECERCDAVMQAYTGCTCRSKPNACPEHHDPTRD